MLDISASAQRTAPPVPPRNGNEIVGDAEAGTYTAMRRAGSPDFETEAWLIATRGVRGLVILFGDRDAIAAKLAKQGLMLLDDNSISGKVRPIDLEWEDTAKAVAS